MATLNLNAEKSGGTTIVKVEGRIDTNTAPEFSAFTDKLVDHGIDDILVDLSGCDFVSSAGLRAIVALQKRLFDGTLVFTGVSDGIMEVFTMTGFDKILTFA